MDKQIIRKIFHSQNYKICKNYYVYKSILKITKKINVTKKKLNLLLYIPKEKEINIYKYRRFLSKNFNLYTTKMLEENQLAFVKLRLPLEVKKYKIKESVSKIEKVKIDIALIPCLGVDADFRRIGFGKGYYDRTFFEIDYDLLIIFIQNTDLILKEKICSKLDIKGDFYITPNKIYKRKELK